MPSQPTLPIILTMMKFIHIISLKLSIETSFTDLRTKSFETRETADIFRDFYHILQHYVLTLVNITWLVSLTLLLLTDLPGLQDLLLPHPAFHFHMRPPFHPPPSLPALPGPQADDPHGGGLLYRILLLPTTDGRLPTLRCPQASPRKGHQEGRRHRRTLQKIGILE